MHLTQNFWSREKRVSTVQESEGIESRTNVIELLHNVDLASEHLHRLGVLDEALCGSPTVSVLSLHVQKRTSRTHLLSNDLDRDERPRALLHTLMHRRKASLPNLPKHLIRLSQSSSV